MWNVSWQQNIFLWVGIVQKQSRNRAIFTKKYCKIATRVSKMPKNTHYQNTSETESTSIMYQRQTWQISKYISKNAKKQEVQGTGQNLLGTRAGTISKQIRGRRLFSKKKLGWRRLFFEKIRGLRLFFEKKYGGAEFFRKIRGGGDDFLFRKN